MFVQSLHLVLCILFSASVSETTKNNSQTDLDESLNGSELTQHQQGSLVRPEAPEKPSVAAVGETEAVYPVPAPVNAKSNDGPRMLGTNAASVSGSERDQTKDTMDFFNTVFSELQKSIKLSSKQTQREEGNRVQFELNSEGGGLRKDMRNPHVTKFQYYGPRQDYFRLTPVNGLNALAESGTNELSECKSIYSCSDCYTARVCRPLEDGTFQHVESIKCPPSAPHCDLETGTCKWQASRECLKPDQFICMSDGHFPDVDCKFYHVCNNLTAERRQCEYEYEYYNADRGHCDAETKFCGIFDCFQQLPGSKTPYTTFPNYFAYCNGKKDPLAIDRCPGGTWLNVTTQNCEAMCSETEGVIQDPVDCTKYYKCYKLWVTKTEWHMMKEHKDCPQGTGFDPKSFLCVSLGELQSCHSTSLQMPNTSKQSPDRSTAPELRNDDWLKTNAMNDNVNI